MTTLYIFDGIDRVGKDTAILTLQEHFYKQNQSVFVHGFASVPKFVPKPEQVSYQISLYSDYLMQAYDNNYNRKHEDMIFVANRFHFGEYVYGPRYRNYDEADIKLIDKFDQHLYSLCHHGIIDVKLVLLTTSSFDHLVDDGLSHDWSQKVDEQKDFVKAFFKSKIENKIIIDTYDYDTKTYKDRDKILQEILTI